MVFQHNLIAVVKCNGKVLRERNIDGTQEVTLPFGSDYSLLLKNKDSRKVVVVVEIDGQDVLDHNELVINPNSESELLGFMSGSVVRNMFRFIRKTQAVSDHRGDRIDDGIIRISFRYEQRVTTIVHEHHEHYHVPTHPWTYPYPYPGPMWQTTACRTDAVIGDAGPSPNDLSDEVQISDTFNTAFDSSHVHANTVLERSLSESGITVTGRPTHQQFHGTHVGPLEDATYVINIVLRGTVSSGQVVSEPITVATKLTCKSCGSVWSSTQDYCGSCGTYLR